MLKFRDIPYQRPDMEALKAVIEEAVRKVRAANSYAEVREAYFTVQEKEQDADTMYTVAHVRNTIDTTDAFYDGEIRWLREAEARLIPAFKDWKTALAGSAFRGEFEAEFGTQLFHLYLRKLAVFSVGVGCGSCSPLTAAFRTRKNLLCHHLVYYVAGCKSHESEKR